MFYMAHWVFDSPENSDRFQFELEKLRPVEIKCIIKHTIQADDMNFTYLLAHVLWLKYFPERFKYGKPLQICHRNEFFNTNYCFVPIQLLGQECAYQDIMLDYTPTVLLVPLSNN